MTHPTRHEIDAAFAPLETALRQLATGEAIAVDNVPHFVDCEGLLQPLPSAIQGWVECWQALLKRNRYQLDLQPLRQLARLLANDQPITPQLVQHAQRLTTHLRLIYARLDVYQVGKVARTLETRYLMEVQCPEP